MEDHGQRSRFLIVCCALVAVSLVVVASFRSQGLGASGAVKIQVMNVTYPIQEAVGWCMNALRNIRSAATDSSLSARVSALEAENALLRSELLRLQEVEAENERLRSLVGFAADASYRSVAARVIARDRGSWLNLIVVDKGTADGVTVNSPVMGVNGIVGRVTTVALRSATVMLLSDPQSAVSAIVQRNRAMVVVEGKASPDGSLSFTCLETGDRVQIGDVLITSGLGGVFPKGLMLGTVTHVTKGFYGISDEGSVEPGANLQSLEEVLIMLPSNDEAH